MRELDSSHCWDNVNTTAVGLSSGQTPEPSSGWAMPQYLIFTCPQSACASCESSLGSLSWSKPLKRWNLLLDFGGKKPLGVRTAGCQRWLLGRTRNRKQAKEFCWDLRPSNYSTSTNEIHANPQVNHCFVPSVQSRHSWFCKGRDLLPDEPPSLSHLLGETTLMSIFDHLFVLP